MAGTDEQVEAIAKAIWQAIGNDFEPVTTQDQALVSDLSETAARAAIAALPAVGVIVKPLEWRKHPVGIVASTGQGASYIVDDRGDFRPKFIRWPSGNFAPDIGSLVEAKAAAQADYERRILSALTTPQGADQ